MTRFTAGVRLGAALASLVLVAACSADRSADGGILEPGAAPAFLSAGSSSADWQQCANNGRNDAIPCEWINSVLNPGKATYREGELIPFRFAVHLVDLQNKKPVPLDINATRSVTFTYGFNKGANGNYDFIGKFNQTEGVRANLCSADFAPVNAIYCTAGAAGSLAGTLRPAYGQPSPKYDNAADPNAAKHTIIEIQKSTFTNDPDLPANIKGALQAALDNYVAKGGKLEIDVFGGVGLNVADVNYNFGGNDVTATMTVRFRANQPDVLIAFGAHFARIQDWSPIGYNGGAGQSGSPFHIKVDNIDGTTVGALGNNVSGGVVVREANVTLAKTVSASTITVGQPFSWTITATNNGDGDAANLVINDPLPTITGYSYSTSSPGCSIANGTLTCGPTTVAAGGGTFTAVVSAAFTGSVTPATSCGSFPNVANIVGGGNAQVTITIQCPGLNVVKVADNLTVSAGSQIGFFVTLNSTGPGTALGATLSDPLPTGTGIVWSIVAEDSDAGCAIANNTLSCSYGNLAAGQSRSVHVVSPTTAASCQAYPNTASAQATNHAQVQASATTTVQCPSLDLTKVADQATVSAGTTIGYVLTVTNGGAGTATGVVLTDVLPTNTGLVWTIDAANSSTGCAIATGTLTCNFGDLATNASKHVHITSPTVFASCGTVNNTGNVTTTNNGSDQASAAITVQCPALEITKNADQSTVSAGMPIAFTVIVRNTGAGTAAGVTLSDPLPGGAGVDWAISPAYASPGTCQITGTAPTQTLSCSFGSLASSASASVRVSSPTTAASCKQYPNTGTAQATNHAPVQAQSTITVQCPQLDLTKIADQATVSAGDPIGFTMTVTNSGAGTATGVTLTDALPANAGLSWTISPAVTGCAISGGTLTCNFGSLGPNGTASVHVTSPTTFASCGTVNNTANVTTTNNGADQASASVTVQCPALEIAKTADAATVSAGAAIGFTIVVRNTGTGIARSVSLSDALPGGSGVTWTLDPAVAGCAVTGSAPSQSLACSFGDLAASATRTVHLTSPTAFLSCKEYANTATAQATNHALVQSQASTTVQCPSISLTKVADQGTVSAGTTIGFTMTVTNAGPGTATGVTLTDVLPTGTGLSWTISPAVAGCAIGSGTLTCNFGSLGVDSRQVHISSPTTFASCGTVNNTAQVTTSNNGTDQESASVVVQCPALAITKTADSTGSVTAGHQIGFTITLANGGAGLATGVTLSDPLPGGSGVTWTLDPAVTGCAVTGSAPTQTLACSFGDLAASATRTVHLTSPTTALSCKAYANTATAQATNHGQVTATATNTVACPTLTIDKTPDQVGNAGYKVNPGSPATFTITVTNTGAGAALNTVLTDTLPEGLTWSDNQGVCTTSTITAAAPPRQILLCSIGTLAANGGSFTVQVSAPVPSDFLLPPASSAVPALEIDGDLTGTQDWGGLPLSVLNCGAAKLNCAIDKLTGGDDDALGQGAKEDTPIPSVVTGSIPNNKSDLLRFYLTSRRVAMPVNAPPAQQVVHDILYLAWERVQEPTGTTNMDFELNRSTARNANGTPVRSAGDVLIKYDLSKGGGTLTLGYHRWVTSGNAATVCEASNAVPCWGPVTPLSAAVASGASNTEAIGPVTDPIAPDAPRTLSVLTFGEAAIDLQGAGIFQSNVCLVFGQAYLKSRSSDAFTSELKDFIAPIPVDVENCQDRVLDNRAWVKASNFLPAAGIFDAGQILVTQGSTTASLPGTFMREQVALAGDDGVVAGRVAGRVAVSDVAAVQAVATSALAPRAPRSALARREAAIRSDDVRSGLAVLAGGAARSVGGRLPHARAVVARATPPAARPAGRRSADIT